MEFGLFGRKEHRIPGLVVVGAGTRNPIPWNEDVFCSLQVKVQETQKMLVPVLLDLTTACSWSGQWHNMQLCLLTILSSSETATLQVSKLELCVSLWPLHSVFFPISSFFNGGILITASCRCQKWNCVCRYGP